MSFRSYALTTLAIAALATVAADRGIAAPQLAAPALVASGLNNPRGLTFGADGTLYVAEGGTGGSLTTSINDCQQVPSLVGPYSGGFTARISKIVNGAPVTVAGNLPSSQTTPTTGSLVSGVADVAFV